MIDIMLWEGDPPGVYKNDIHRCRKRARCNLCDKTLPGCNSYDGAGKEAREHGWFSFTLSSPHRCIDVCDTCARTPLADIINSLMAEIKKLPPETTITT